VKPSGRIEVKLDKNKNGLDSLKRDFRRELLPRLRAAIEGKESLLFCVSELNYFQEVNPPAESDRLFESAMRIESLRAQLTLSSDQEPSLTAAFIDCCKEYNNVSNHHRRSAEKLAASLLSLLQMKK
jgi:hypothetical protein